MKKVVIYIIFIIVCILVGIYFVTNHVEIRDADSEFKDESIVYSVSDIKVNLKCVDNFTIHDNNIICATSRGLFLKDYEGNIIPDLAESYEIKDNGIEYLIKIKDDCYFSNGSKISAKDFVDFFKELSDYEEEQNIKALLDVFGITDYRNKKCTFENTGITYENNILKIRLNVPNNNFLDELTKIQYKLRKSLNLWENITLNNKKILFSGEYSIDYADNNEMIIYKNKYSNSKNNIECIILKKDESSEFAMADYQIGKRDIVIEPPKDYLASLKDKNELFTNISNRVMITQFNNTLEFNKRCNIYKMLYTSITNYVNENMYYIEPAECSYNIQEKNNINIIQSRKVIMNSIDYNNDINKISILAEDNPENRYWIEYIKKYFEDKYNIVVNYYLGTSEEMNDNELIKRYDIYMYSEDLFLESESNNDELFNNCLVRPLFFYNNNIAVSAKITNFKLDFYGAFDFLNMQKH